MTPANAFLEVASWTFTAGGITYTTAAVGVPEFVRVWINPRPRHGILDALRLTFDPRDGGRMGYANLSFKGSLVELADIKLRGLSGCNQRFSLEQTDFSKEAVVEHVRIEWPRPDARSSAELIDRDPSPPDSSASVPVALNIRGQLTVALAGDHSGRRKCAIGRLTRSDHAERISTSLKILGASAYYRYRGVAFAARKVQGACGSESRQRPRLAALPC